MTQELWIPGKMPSLNELISAAKGFRGSGLGYARLKRKWTTIVKQLARAAKLKPMQRAHVAFEWVEATRKRDPDGVCSGGAKCVLDGLVEAGVLPDDGQDEVVSFTHTWRIDRKKPGVLVKLTPAE